MRKYILLMITIIQTLEVNAEIFGSREPGDYILMTLNLGVNNIGCFRYPPEYPTVQRAEFITYIVTTPLSNSFIGTEAGVGFNHYYQEMESATQHSATLYGKPRSETLTTGILSLEDKLLHIETFTKRGVPNKIISLSFKYPKNNSKPTLTWLSLVDDMHHDPAAVKVVKGGVGFNQVHVRMNSRVGEDLKVRIQLYGRDVNVDNWPWYVSYNAATDALLFKVYWVFDKLSLPPVKKNCGCKSGRLLPPRKN